MSEEMLKSTNTSEERQRIEIQNKIATLLSEMLQIVNELAIEISILENESCKNCSIVNKCKRIIKNFKQLIEIQRSIKV